MCLCVYQGKSAWGLYLTFFLTLVMYCGAVSPSFTDFGSKGLLLSFDRSMFVVKEQYGICWKQFTCSANAMWPFNVQLQPNFNFSLIISSSLIFLLFCSEFPEYSAGKGDLDNNVCTNLDPGSMPLLYLMLFISPEWWLGLFSLLSRKRKWQNLNIQWLAIADFIILAELGIQRLSFQNF